MGGVEVRDREIESLTVEVAQLPARLNAEAPALPPVAARTGRGRPFLTILLIAIVIEVHQRPPSDEPQVESEAVGSAAARKVPDGV